MNKLVAMKMNIDDEMQASLLLNSLPSSWDTLVVTISNSTPNEILTMESVKDSLLNEEAIRKKKRKARKTRKGVEEVKVEIPMVLEEDQNPKYVSNVTIATSLATLRKSVGFGKRNRMK